MILYVAIPGSILAPFFWMSAVKHRGAARIAIFMNLIPVATAIAAAICLGETLHIYHVIGGSMTVPGIVLVQRQSGRKRQRIRERQQDSEVV